MATMLLNKMELEELRNDNRWVVIHPLDDAPETKVDTAALGPMKMTRSVKLSLHEPAGVSDSDAPAGVLPRLLPGRFLRPAHVTRL